MTSTVGFERTVALRRAAVRATLAPSVRNSQPWSLRLHNEQLDLYIDSRHQSAILDSSGRELTISCGAALLNARLSLAAAGLDVEVERFPDSGNRDLLARITPVGDERPQAHSQVSLASPAALGMLDDFVESRRTNHHQFTSDEVPAEVVAILGRAVEAEQCLFAVVESEEHRSALALITKRAQAEGGADLDASSEEPDSQCLVIVGSIDDRPLDWLRTGEALERMLLETTRQGFVAGPTAQTIVAPADRAALRTRLELAMTPQVVLRIGRAPVSLASRRRRLVDVLAEQV